MKTTVKTTGKIVFGNSIKLSTIDAIKSTRENLDLLYPERITYLVLHHGTVFYSKLEIVDDKLLTDCNNLIDLNGCNLIYIIDDSNIDMIEPLSKSKCNFSMDYVILDNDPVVINWEYGEFLDVKNVIK